MIEKLKSRKFLMALISVIAGICTMLGASDEIIKLVSSLGLIVVPVIVYIATEGKIDAAAVEKTEIAAGEILELLLNKDTEESSESAAENSAETN
jgi:multisubunit Na+/H+ antiporter MnhC subunit